MDPTRRPDLRVRRDREAPAYIAHVVPGLEDLVRTDLARHVPNVTILRTLERFDERTSLILFRSGGDPKTLVELRAVEDLFALIVQVEDVASGESGLRSIRSAIGSGHSLDRALPLALQTRPRRRGKPTVRVIARKAGAHSFRRIDVQRAAERGALDHFPSWRLVEDDAQLEIWVTLVGSTLIAGLRLSDNSMRQRTYRRVSLPASLKPTVAYAMVELSQPRDDDVFLDPMCGSGTVLIERAHAGRYRLLLGGDADPEAVRAARENVGPRYKPIEVRRWDARSLPLENASVSALVTNMPFGKQIGTAEENRSLYPALLEEWRRVLAPGGRMVLLSGERQLLRQALRKQPGLTPEREIPVLVRGYPAAIFVVRIAH